MKSDLRKNPSQPVTSPKPVTTLVAGWSDEEADALVQAAARDASLAAGDASMAHTRELDALEAVIDAACVLHKLPLLRGACAAYVQQVKALTEREGINRGY